MCVFVCACVQVEGQVGFRSLRKAAILFLYSSGNLLIICSSDSLNNVYYGIHNILFFSLIHLFVNSIKIHQTLAIFQTQL